MTVVAPRRPRRVSESRPQVAVPAIAPMLNAARYGKRRSTRIAQERRVPVVDRVVDAHERADDQRRVDRRADQIGLEDAGERHLRRRVRAGFFERCRSSQIGLSGTRARIQSVNSAGTIATQNMTRQARSGVSLKSG